MKRTEFLGEIRGLSLEEKKARSIQLHEELMKLRFRKASGQLEQQNLLKDTKLKIAQVKTLIREEKLREEKSVAGSGAAGSGASV